MVIQHNVFALFASRENKVVWEKKKKSTEKLSTGYRINRAADDAAGLAISEEMRKQIRGLNRGAQNIDEGIKYCQTADGALNEVHDMLQRMNELAVQSANGTNSESDRAAITDEVDHLKTEIDRIFTTTRYNEEYIFKTDEPEETEIKPYILTFKGYPDNIFIYNETYDSNTGTATYGGIFYKGTRYAWSGISSTMYDPNTNTFRKGTYTLNAGGTYLTLTCEDGSKPPQVSSEYIMMANASGIKVNGENIDWKDVKDDSGKSIRTDYIEAKNYSFDYHGVKISFKPEPEDDFSNVMSKLSYTRWKSKYQIPHEDTALYGNFDSTRAYFSSNEQVKEYLWGNPVVNYTVRASDGTNGTYDGIWLEDKDGNTVNGSKKSWAQLGITNWGDGSKDISENKTYTYSCNDPINSGSAIKFSFTVRLNEISKDSAIDALDGVTLAPSKNKNGIFNNDVTIEMSGNIAKASANIISKKIDITPEEQYGLGRDFSKASHLYGSEQLICNTTTSGIAVSVSYSKTLDGTTTTKTYTGTNLTVVDDVAKAISISLNNSKDGIMAARYKAGATNPMLHDLSQLVTMTGSGQDTNLKDVYRFASTTTTSSLKSTYVTNPNYSYAGASIDFSGLGTNYNLMDLIGMGFNSTCQTCTNHYSMQFVTNDMISSAQWEEDGNKYKYLVEQDGNNYTLYVNLDSMKGKINDGAEFTNALIDIINSINSLKTPAIRTFYNHYTKYATYKDKAILYVFDERSDHSSDPYVKNGVSTADKAAFQPRAFETDTKVGFDVKLFDTDDPKEYVTIRYECDFSDTLSADRLVVTTTINNASGAYIEIIPGKKYEPYDANNPAHSTLTRYDITDVSINVRDADLKSYAENLIKSVVEDTKLKLTGNNATYGVSAEVKDNKAMVTDYNTPYQIMPPDKDSSMGDFLNIQCSSNAGDFIRIQRQKLSVKKLGLTKLSVGTQAKATKAMAILENVMAKVSRSRSAIGAYQNRLEHAYAINQNTAENTQYAESKIRDTDMADEMVKYSNYEILSQAGISMLAQANQTNQAVLNLIK